MEITLLWINVPSVEFVIALTSVRLIPHLSFCYLGYSPPCTIRSPGVGERGIHLQQRPPRARSAQKGDANGNNVKGPSGCLDMEIFI